MGLTSGTKLGPYEIVSPLGAGGMGEVYRARDTRLDRTVAIKILPAHLSENPEARQRFDREARAISALSHPNICHLYDVGQHDGISYLVMEYLEGETLGERLRKGRLPLEQVFRVGAEICHGLEQAHRSGVVHRDLKPGNIMLTKSGAKLMDFGLAKTPASPLGNLSGSNSLATMSQPLTTEGTIVGTIQYMAPEQLEGKEADKRSDIFALGSVLYEMITGKRAFEGKTTASTIASILAAEPKPLSAMQPLSPPALERVIATCIAKDPEERWQSCADVSRQLEWVAKEPNAAERSSAQRKASLDLLAAACIDRRAPFFLGTRWSKVPARVSQFEVNPPPNTYFNFRGLSGPPVPSPDGSKIAFMAFTQGKTGTAGLWLRSLDSAEARFLTGTEGAMYPFWSPDGKFLAFFAGGKLKKLDLSGGTRFPSVMSSRVAAGPGPPTVSSCLVHARAPCSGWTRPAASPSLHQLERDPLRDQPSLSSISSRSEALPVYRASSPNPYSPRLHRLIGFSTKTGHGGRRHLERDVFQQSSAVRFGQQSADPRL